MTEFSPQMNPDEIRQISMLGLAHVGDAVYELMVRTRLCAEGHQAAQDLHRQTVARVNASAQALAMRRLQPLLSAEELSVYKRGRNTKVHSVPHNADISEYHAATGLEALFGWLYLRGDAERLETLFDAAMEGTGDAS